MPLPTNILIEELKCQLALWRVNGIGPKLMQEILQQYETAVNAFANVHEMPEALAQLMAQANFAYAEKDLTWLAQEHHHLLLKDAENFPRPLAEIASAPPFIFVKGDPTVLQEKQIAIVGSRNPTFYGNKVAQFFTEQLAQAGLIITSGLALGIDAICHQSALTAHGKTVAVLAVGLDQVYPKRHQQLAEDILARGGAIISEFGVGSKALAENFPRRNRLISGLSLGVLVIEATLKSGSLITARYALEQGREVFAVPGSIFQTLSQGCHALIKQGAKCVEMVSDILLELNLLMTISEGVQKPQATKASLTAQQKQVLACLHEVPQSFDALQEQVNMATTSLQVILTQLLLQEFIQETWHGYVRNG